MAKATKEQLKASAKAACEKAIKAYPNASQAFQMKAAQAIFLLDSAGVKGEERKQAALDYLNTPTYFGASANCLTTGFNLIAKRKGDSGMIEEFTG